MDAVEYFREKNRMTENCMIFCEACKLHKGNNGTDYNCDRLLFHNPEKAVAIVENWSKEHPRKTILMDFLEKYPKAKFDNDGLPSCSCPYELGYDNWEVCEFQSECYGCWNRPMVVEE